MNLSGQSYFTTVASKLTNEELVILTLLHEHQADASFKALKNTSLMKLAELSTFKYKRAITRLEALNFIVVNATVKEHRTFITQEGIEALLFNFEEEVQ